MRDKTKIYSVFLDKASDNPLESAVYVRDSFSIWAFIFNIFWTLYHRVWRLSLLCALVFISATLALKFGYITLGTSMAIRVTFSLWLGMEAQEWRAAALERRGFMLYDVVAAQNDGEAKIRFLDKYFAKQSHAHPPITSSPWGKSTTSPSEA